MSVATMVRVDLRMGSLKVNFDCSSRRGLQVLDQTTPRLSKVPS